MIPVGRILIWALIVAACCGTVAFGEGNVLTWHNDNSRVGANTNETVLTPANVKTNTFGKLFSYAVDGFVYAQPLYVSSLTIPGKGTHNMVYVATEHNTIYAFDADSNEGASGGVMWQTNLGVSAVTPNDDFGQRYGGAYTDIVPEAGITGTPVIDLASQTLYADVFTHEGSAYVHRIHALNIVTGAEQPHSPVVVTASVPGAGVASSNSVVTFDPEQQLQRSALTLAGGVLYVPFAGYADTDPYHGWVIGFDAMTLEPLTNLVFNITPNATTAKFGANAGEGGIWMGGNGLSVDGNTNLYFMTGNGSFSAKTNGIDFGDSFMKLSTTNGLQVADYFTPHDESSLSSIDADLGSSGPMLLPDSAGNATHPHLIVGCGKNGRIYLIDVASMGHYNSANDNQILQNFSVGGNPISSGGVLSSPAYWNNTIYYAATSLKLKAFRTTNAAITTAATSQSSTTYGFPGATPSVSANGTSNGIVWTIQSDAWDSSGAEVLHAYNATNVSLELYNSNQLLTRDNPGAAVKMTVPTVINGKVYVGAQYALSVYGNSSFLPAPTITPNGGSFTNSILVTLSNAAPGTTIYYTIDGTAPTTNSLLYSGPFLLGESRSSGDGGQDGLCEQRDCLCRVCEQFCRRARHRAAGRLLHQPGLQRPAGARTSRSHNRFQLELRRTRSRRWPDQFLRSLDGFAATAIQRDVHVPRDRG